MYGTYVCRRWFPCAILGSALLTFPSYFADRRKSCFFPHFSFLPFSPWGYKASLWSHCSWMSHPSYPYDRVYITFNWLLSSNTGKLISRIWDGVPRSEVCIGSARRGEPRCEAKAQRDLSELWSSPPACFTPKPFLRMASRLKVDSEPTVSPVCSAFPTEWNAGVFL